MLTILPSRSASASCSRLKALWRFINFVLVYNYGPVNRIDKADNSDVTLTVS